RRHEFAAHCEGGARRSRDNCAGVEEELVLRCCAASHGRSCRSLAGRLAAGRGRPWPGGYCRRRDVYYRDRFIRGYRAVGWQYPAEKEGQRSEEHTSELQSHSDLVCRL